MSDHPFDVDTASQPAGSGRYHAQITDRWHTANQTPNGGYLAALLLRAIGNELPYPDPLTCTTTYLRPAVPGPGEIEVTSLRTGRTTASAQALLTQNGAATVHTVATFIDRAQASGRTERFEKPPELPPAAECFDPANSGLLRDLTIARRVEYRLAAPPGWAMGEPSGRPESAFWIRMEGGRDVDTYALAFLVDAYAPAILELGPLQPATVQLSTYLHATPAPGWLACRHSTRFITDGYHDENFEIWDSAGTLVAESHQLATLL